MLGITFRQLQVFVDVVDLGSFRICAERLGVTQVSVSGHIRALELMLGQPLFERRRGTTSDLTAAGRVVYQHAMAMVEQMQSLIDEMESPNEAWLRRRLVVAGPRYVTYRLTRVLAEFGLAHPEWHIQNEPNDEEPASGLVDRGRADLGFVMSLAGSAAGDVVWREQLGLYVGRDHPLAHRKRVAPVELSSLPMIYLPKKDLLRPVLDKALAGAGVAGNPMALQTSNAALARRSLMQGRSIGCLFTHLVQADVADGTLVALPISAKLPAVEVTIAKSKRLLTQRPVALLLEMIRRGLAAEGG